jgi:hypothetical protein
MRAVYGVDAMKGCEQPPQFHPRGRLAHAHHAECCCRRLGPSRFQRALHDIGKPPTAIVDEEGASLVTTGSEK